MSVDEITFEFDDPLQSRACALYNLQNILTDLKKLSQGKLQSNPYGIEEWDDPSLILEVPELICILKAFHIELALHTEEDGRMVLYGGCKMDQFFGLKEEAQYLLRIGAVRASDLVSIDWNRVESSHMMLQRTPFEVLSSGLDFLIYADV
jgi:hypothetical protein